MIEIPTTTDTTIERLLVPLIDVFPQGATAERLKKYAELLQPEKFTNADLEEGVKRTIHGWDRTTFPPFAKVLANCNGARQTRLEAERWDDDHQGRDRGEKFNDTATKIVHAVEMFRESRARDMPEREPDIRTNREARQKHLGIKPLTPEEIELFNRNRRERERKRQQESDPKPPQGEDGVPF
jgi:hypothetical protein